MFPQRNVALAAAAFLQILSNVDAVQVPAEAFARGKYDFVIVGGGSAGLALATRLSDNPKLTVGVIEAGLVRLDDKILIPGMFGSTLGDPEYDWNFATVPQSHLGNRQLPVFRGKLLGGTSALNGLVHSRASKAEYDGLQALGNPGWNFETLQDGMKKSENWTAPSRFLQKTYFANNDVSDHGTKGAIQDSVYSFYADVVTPFFKAAQNLKITINKAMGYYAPNAHRNNLVVVTGAHVTKIITKKTNGLVSATSVEYLSGNVTYTVAVGKEVVLSAGIGNKKILNALSIPVAVDLPGVGENHHDHFGPQLAFQSLDNFITPDRSKTDPAFAAQQFAQYAQNRTGTLSATSATTLAFLPMHDIMSPSTSARLLSDLDAALTSMPTHLKSQFALQRKWLDDQSVPQVEFVLFSNSDHLPYEALSGATPQPGKSYYTIAVFLQHLWSRGSVHISTSNPLTAPNIDGDYLNSPGDFGSSFSDRTAHHSDLARIDMKLLIESVKWAQKLSQTEPMKSATVAVLRPVLNATDAQIRDFITSSANTEWHFAGSMFYTGTASMLPRDQNGVVDPQLKVYGTSNIRVVDASILPVHVATHPTMTLYGIAERAAEALRTGEWK
ncbi:hypothetical protein DXG01_012717 [Tephrocybe rancida]|nr:hypothetical protein DXG01_012717 [Tephrocybe rancida]